MNITQSLGIIVTSIGLAALPLGVVEVNLLDNTL